MRRWVVLGLAAAAAGCFVGAGSLAGKTCESNVDCPEPYVCAQVGTTARTCELLRGPDDGPGKPPTVARPLDYCHDAKPIIDRTCVSNCHGADTTRGVTGFRLDAFTFTDGTPGVKAKATNVVNRTNEDSMPPPNPVNPRPTKDERDLLARWLETGALECVDAGTADGGK